MKIFFAILGLTVTSSALACMGGPENISLAKHDAAMTALKEDKKFKFRMGEAGAIKNIKIEGEKVTIELETNTGKKSVRVYETKPVNSGTCDERVAKLKESREVNVFDSEKACGRQKPVSQQETESVADDRGPTSSVQ